MIGFPDGLPSIKRTSISEEFRNTAQSFGDHNGTFLAARTRNLSRVPESNTSRTDQDEGSAQQAT